MSDIDYEGRRKLYDKARWKKLRAAQLSKQPLCERCLSKSPSVLTPASVAHHKVPHKGNKTIFFDPDNLASSCKHCHDSIEQQIEYRGFSTIAGNDGLPIDPNHPFNKQ